MSLIPFLEHHSRRVLRESGEPNVLLNCHARAVHSTMLHDQPGNRVRLFFAEPEHTLWRNDPLLMAEDMTLSVHPHHCDLTLIRLFGEAVNVTGEMIPNIDGAFHECLYSSAILGGKGALQPTGHKFNFGRRKFALLSTDGTPMRAKDLHTIHVPRGQSAAWLVMEGAADPAYKPVCYTANPHFSMAGMYVRGSWIDAAAMLRSCISHMTCDTYPSLAAAVAGGIAA